MTIDRKVKREKKHNSPILAIALIGAGVLLLGGLVFLLLPRSNAGGEIAAVGEDIGSVDATVSYVAQVEFPAPSLHLSDVDGAEVSLEDFLGKVVLVNNWAIWCPPCKAEMPTLQAYYDDHREQDFLIIGIEAGSPSSEVTAFVERFELTFPIWLDPDVKALKVFQNFGLPNSYVIDRNGTVRLAWSGEIDRATLEEFVTPLLEE
jgi:peroxiredoxin